MVSHVHNLWINSRFRSRQQIRRERWEKAAFAGYKVGKEIFDIGGVAALRFSYREHRFLKQIFKLEAKQIRQNLHTSQSRVGKNNTLPWQVMQHRNKFILNTFQSRCNGCSWWKRLLCSWKFCLKRITRTYFLTRINSQQRIGKTLHVTHSRLVF